MRKKYDPFVCGTEYRMDVFCDHCKLLSNALFMISEYDKISLKYHGLDEQAELRLRHIFQHGGWLLYEDNDYSGICPKCAAKLQGRNIRQGPFVVEEPPSGPR